MGREDGDEGSSTSPRIFDLDQIMSASDRSMINRSIDPLWWLTLEASSKAWALGSNYRHACMLVKMMFNYVRFMFHFCGILRDGLRGLKSLDFRDRDLVLPALVQLPVGSLLTSCKVRPSFLCLVSKPIIYDMVI